MKKRPLYVEVRVSNPKRLATLVQPGDMIETFVYTGHRSGEYMVLDVRAVAHWGIYAKLREEDANKKHYSWSKSFREKMLKRQFLIKWCHIKRIFLQGEVVQHGQLENNSRS